MRGAQEPEETKSTPPPAAAPEPPTNGWRRSGSPPADTRSLLLNLLNQPKPSQTDSVLTKAAAESSPQPADQHADSTQYYAQQHRQQDDSYDDVRQPDANDAQTYSASGDAQNNDISAFYQLMDKLSQSSPQQTNNAAAQNSAPSLQILKRDGKSPAAQRSRDHSQNAGSDRSAVLSPQEQARQALNRTGSYQHQSPHSVHQGKASPTAGERKHSHAAETATKEPVSVAVSDIADKADRDAREALERAEHSQSQHEATGHRHEHKANNHYDSPQDRSGASDDAKADRDDDSKYGRHHDDDHLGRETVHHMHVVEDPHGIADSWESADQDEIVVIEEPEEPPVKVYNFPMKPWISITLQDESTEPRPEFRDETIMDIARLKKEFDQIDRNLYTASQTYMTYGMSKHGGLRVIRQDDGKDAKVFTDTKDRIFNVSMSVTPSDHDGPQKEAIIGTGISGTVYWVQIKDGQKDHIDDAHLEQYGFALPPVTTQDGDAPGGALKTRARASTSHPEYFAMGRGKCIHFIWPSYILQNNLFKPGHDRVADTEALLKQCSLKINTGKAGKDFTFSQDDSVVVSLDKSGRVKFWDVRDLTAVKEDSSSRHPLPAHTSLEVKEPLMTLASTPEGEKAWPTSVLLLDKQRPYQKRCALRYMIVGMKQNHTLQLWDLALGKPVQEFNLPHSKESDAVCSVMYHPASGMIVIGHPTRNSIYFAHLSAPKYNLKSVSQAEYIQRLVAQDPSIPQPDSTAVISGIREYSFANRGILRSLDILSNPAMLQDVDEPTLFELYAMHSKGVACLLIKQHELGWSKENKVLQAVDAVNEGIVTVSKLKTPQPSETPADTGRAAPQANRSAPKDSLVQTTPAQSDTALRGPESVTPVKVKGDGKDSSAETPVPSSKETQQQSDKSERKSRKKKGKDSEQSAANGSATPRDGASGKTDAGKGHATASLSSDALDTAIATLETRLSNNFSDTLKASLRTLQGKLDDGARVRDESFNQHQLKLLDMVSQVLNENTQQVLETFIRRQFTELVIPAIGEKVQKSVSDVVNKQLQPTLVSTIQKEVQNAIPQALNRSLRSGDFVNSIADRVGPSVASGLQQELVSTLVQRLSPALSNMAAQSAQHVASEIHQQYRDQFDQMRSQQRADANKIDQLLSHVTRLTETMNGMAAAQTSLQTEFLKFKQQQVHELPGVGASSIHLSGGGSSNTGSQGYGSHVGGPSGNASVNNQHQHQHQQHGSYPPSQAPSQSQPFLNSPQYTTGTSQQHARSPLGSGQPSEHVGPTSNISALAGAYANQMNRSEAEADNDITQRIRLIEGAIQDGRLQDAVIQWVQSGREEEIFRRCLSRYAPAKFAALPPLMLLVVIATISKDLKASPRLKEEVDWIEMAVRAFGESLPSYVNNFFRLTFDSFTNISAQDWDKQGHREVMRSASQTMQLLINRIQPLMTSLHDGFPTDPFLMKLERGKLEWIVGTSQQILDSFTPRRYE